MILQTFTGLDIIIDDTDFDNNLGKNFNVEKDEKDASGYKKEIILTLRIL